MDLSENKEGYILLFEKQKFQEDCVDNIVKVLDETDLSNNDYSNLSKVLAKLNIESNQTQFITSSKSKIDVIMETGTGKTFTYIKTIHELYKQYGKNRFIIVVPRNAIKLGVIQNLKLTDEYFFNEYKRHINIIEYPKDGLSRIEHEFLHSDQKISVLILTNSSFNSDKNLINRMPENGTLFKNGTIWDNISKQNPVIIIDEPHLLKGTETQKSFDRLNSLFIRFGATYPNEKKLSNDIRLSNVAYSLDSISSFNQYLVKRIGVNTIFSGSEMSEYLLSGIESRKNQFKLSYFINDECYSKTIKLKSDIGIITGLSSLKGVHATKINKDVVYLSNKRELSINSNFALSEDETRLMIRSTIRKHFEKEQLLFNQDIKVLSLFFIPNVANFRGDNPIVKRIFEEEYIAQREKIYNSTKNKKYKEYLDKDFIDGSLSVHEGYFSGDKGTSDNKIEAGVDQILNKKEELLSFNTPLRFIFSVWALQEGWDNPNIFNICKLSNTSKEISRRQQVGRGLRIAVNQDGKRLTYKYLNENEKDFYDVNMLNMFVSHYELDFINNIQREIEEASFCIVGDTLNNQLLIDKGLTEREANKLINLLDDEGIITYSEETETYNTESSVHEFISNNADKLKFANESRKEDFKEIFKEVKPSVINANKKSKKVKIRQDKLNEFKELWETINRKAKLVYKELNEETIIKIIADKFNKERIDPIEIKIIEKIFNSQTNQIVNKSEDKIADKAEFFKATNYQAFIISFIQDEKLRLPLDFVVRLLNNIDIQKIENNPKKAKTFLKKIIIDEIHNSLIQKVDYDFENEIRVTSLQDEDSKEYFKEVEYTVLGKNISKNPAGDNLLYDTIVFDSKIEEAIQTNDPETVNDNKITVFAKLPKISIPTPYKNYNPDFAYLINRKDGKKLFLVVESKGYESESQIPEDENNKIEYAKIFFKKLQKILPEVDIVFKTRINKQDLSSLLTEIEQGK